MNYNKFYVTMNDAFSSNFRTDGKTDKIIIECDTLQDVEIVIDNAENRSDMKYINWHMKKYPYYNPKNFAVQVHDKNDYPRWFEKGYFNKGGILKWN